MHSSQQQSQARRSGGNTNGGNGHASTFDSLGVAVFGSICLGAGALGIWQMQRFDSFLHHRTVTYLLTCTPPRLSPFLHFCLPDCL